MDDSTSSRSRQVRRWGFLVVGVLLVACVVAVLQSLDQGDPVADVPPDVAASLGDGRHGDPLLQDAGAGSDASKVPSAQVVADDRPPAKWRGRESTPPLTSPDEPAAVAIRTLLPLAEAGRADAMRELSQRLVNCRTFVGVDEAAMRQRMLRYHFDRHGRMPASEAEIGEVAEGVERGLQSISRCRDIDPALMDARVGWLERAAGAGDITAMVEYAEYGLNDLRGAPGRWSDDLLAHFDEIARRRQLARDFLQTALDRGACDALLHLGAGHAGGVHPRNWLFKADPFMTLVYAEAADQIGLTHDAVRSSRDRVPEPERQRAAVAQGAAIANRYCRG